MIRVETGSRLHFGLLSLPTESEPGLWPDGEGRPSIPARHFGGAGLMIELPGLALTVAPSATWSAHGDCASRALEFAKKICSAWNLDQTFEIQIERCPPEHVGLGTGTQLGLAVAKAIAVAVGRDISAPELAKLVGRGKRSALGIHGFAHGGFLVEGGKRRPDDISPLVTQLPFPDEWSVLLVIPRDLQGDYGPRELQAFEQLARTPVNLARTDSLCRLLLLGMIPALIERDLPAFGEALFDFNRRVGEMFKPWQGGTYAHPLVSKLITDLRTAGVHGVGHSSWGPTVFAIMLREQTAEIADWLTRKSGVTREEIVVTRARNGGAKCERGQKLSAGLEV